MTNIMVSKFGNEPNVFGDSLRCGMIGDWEIRKLLKALSNDASNDIVYYGKAEWDEDKAKDYFKNNNVIFIESSSSDNIKELSEIAQIEEFHILLGPHTFYNAGKIDPSWESIKKSLVTQRLLDRVAPQIKFMNANPSARIYFYLSDRRFLLQAGDLTNKNVNILAQCLDSFIYTRLKINHNYSDLDIIHQYVQSFRFDTLWLLDKSYNDYKKNIQKNKFVFNLVISANQVTSDEEIEFSRLGKILAYTKDIPNHFIVGKWTNDYARQKLTENSNQQNWLDGVDMNEHQLLLKNSKYALVLFNTNDSPKQFINNYLTPKYWECVYNGCLTFVEGDNMKNFPLELQVKNGDELKEKLEKCENDEAYRQKLLDLQDSLVLEDYFTGKFFLDQLKIQRSFDEGFNNCTNI